MEKPKNITSFVQPGVYESLKSLVDEINELPGLQGHIKLKLERGGYISITRTCTDCLKFRHSIELSETLCRILGFQKNFDSNSSAIINIDTNIPIHGEMPANLANSLPSTLLVYCDLCEPYYTGDEQTKLLRAVSLDVNKYTYGYMSFKSFAQSIYIPLLFNSFYSIEIDIRDQQGKYLPFDFGTLTVVLHFKQIE